MEATIRPLSRKYYGTEIEVTGERFNTVITVWVIDERYVPSIRELEKGGYKTAQEARENDVTCDSHFESDIGYEISQIIVNALNNAKLKCTK